MTRATLNPPPPRADTTGMVTINGTGFITVGAHVTACDITLGWRPDDPA